MFSLTETSWVPTERSSNRMLAGEPVHLVEDHVVDIFGFLDEGQHALELAAVGGLGGLAPIHEHLHHLGVESLGLAFASLPLGW
jgi:hypothetical protein